MVGSFVLLNRYRILSDQSRFILRGLVRLQSPHRFIASVFFFFIDMRRSRLICSSVGSTALASSVAIGWMDLIVEFFDRIRRRAAVEKLLQCGGYHKVICLNSECKPWIIHIMSLLVILSTYAMEDGQTATSVPHHHTLPS